MSSPTLSPSRRRIWTRRLLVVGLLVLAAQQLWRHGHDYLFAEQFAEVVPGRIYRGAWQKPWPMKRIVRDNHIKVILALAHPPNHPLVAQEKAIARELGCRWVHVPIIDDRTMGDGEMLFDRLEEAAAVLADSSNQPVFFHCHHGINRASMVQMAYRTLYCGWTLQQATDEIARTFGLREVDHGPDYRHMARFYEERVLPRRAKALARSQTQTQDHASKR